MNRQEVFDKVKTHLLTQNKRSINGNEGCLYRHPEGLKCAIGPLLSDEVYTPELEGKTPQHYILSKALADSGLDIDLETGLETFANSSQGLRNDDTKFLSELQFIHDYDPVEEWEIKLKEFAITNNLRY